MTIAPYAVRRETARGRQIAEPESDERSPFQRDRDRVVHSSAFRKLQYKTQVFVTREGDFYRTRLTHSLEVAQIARSIARRLRLDEDLTEALALAHDLGHPPFGHAGESGLNDALKAHGGFDHNAQSLRVVSLLEHRYAAFNGLNLTWEALEGLAKHNGPLLDPPAYIAAFNETYNLNLTKHPSAEAQVAAIADDMAYNAHDLDDGLRASLFSFDDIIHLPLIGDALRRARILTGEPSRIRHEMIRTFINEVVNDATITSRALIATLNPADSDAIRNAPHPVAALSPAMAEATRDIKQFLFDNMYRHWRVNRMSHKAKIVTRELGVLLLERPYLLPGEWRAKAGAPHSATAAETVRDYVAGMTDGYAMQEYARLTDPSVPA